MRNGKVVVTGLLTGSGYSLPPRNGTHTSLPPYTSTGQNESLVDFLRPTVSSMGIQCPIVSDEQLSEEGERASIDNMPSLSITDNAQTSVKPAQVKDAPGLIDDNSPAAMVFPLMPSMREYPRS
mmetsp:Transcript_25875/g.54471  ORF Transcript_25875/g.54471 Transcript_25875/m.54471 type:complete len:124 (-) Transcript_25875:704-1075(-)